MWSPVWYSLVVWSKGPNIRLFIWMYCKMSFIYSTCRWMCSVCSWWFFINYSIFSLSVRPLTSFFISSTFNFWIVSYFFYLMDYWSLTSSRVSTYWSIRPFAQCTKSIHISFFFLFPSQTTLKYISFYQWRQHESFAKMSLQASNVVRHILNVTYISPKNEVKCDYYEENI